MFLKNTVDDLIKNKSDGTEIIVGLDGQWSNPPIEDHPDVTIIYYPESIGQRAMTNQCVKLSHAKYVMKVDAHCAFDKGFDRKMLEAFKEVGDNTTMVPLMKNLHAFDWVCKKCGDRRYQDNTPTSCPKCDNKTDFERDVVWIAKKSPNSVSYCFDPEPHFQYDSGRKKTEEYQRGVIVGYGLWIDPSFTATDSLTQVMSSPLGGSQPSSLTSIISLLTNLTNSHHLPSGTYSFGNGEDVSVDTMGFSSVDNSGSIRPSKIFTIRNEFEVGGITTQPILTEVVNNGNILSPSSGDTSNEPRIKETVCHFVSSETPTIPITVPINSPNPVPTPRNGVDFDILDKLNSVFGGKFVYSEIMDSFHNGSVALKPLYCKDITETMSLQGSCFLMTRQKYWDLNICDESFGSWGSQGIEVAVKSWLSGGRVVCNHKTWYAHMFRTKGGDFGFPYKLSGNQVQDAKKKAKDLFFNNKFEKAIHPLSWLIEKFWPVPHWTQDDLNNLKRQNGEEVITKGIIYYTDNALNMKLANMCRKQLLKAGLPIVSASLKPMSFGKNIWIKEKRGYLTMFKQQLAALEASDADVIFFCEHDCLYPKEHFDFTPLEKDTFYFNLNVWKIDWETKRALKVDKCEQLSGMCVYRELALSFCKEKIKQLEADSFDRHFEPQGKRGNWSSKVALIDIRHNGNLTPNRWSKDQFRNQENTKGWLEKGPDEEIEGWGLVKDIPK